MVEIHYNTSKIRRSTNNAILNWKRSLSVVCISLIVLLLLAFSTDIPWHLQTLKSGISYWDDALLNSLVSIYISGFPTVILTLMYSILSGLVLTNFGLQLLDRNIEVRSLGSMLPGVVATGCASCGIGITGMIGLTGATALLPFNGNLLKLIAVILLVYALHELGDPAICQLSDA